MASRRGSLRPAHKGYQYQDAVTAAVLIGSLVERYTHIVVDKKLVADDKFDDLEIFHQGQRIRHQIKWSGAEDRSLTLNDFIAADSSLRIDALVMSYTRDGIGAANEYRLCAKWRPPPPEEPLSEFIEETDARSTLIGYPSHLYRLKGEDIWPSAGNPRWPPLLNCLHADAEFSRAEFLRFCEIFLIELRLPDTSGSLEEPGSLERYIIDELTGRIGIGQYPNHNRLPTDVAAIAISVATTARTRSATLTPADIERELAIRTDFGRVAQKFPVDDATFHDRPVFRQVLKQAVLRGGLQLVVGPPGAGKSWELTRLAEELTADGAIVARHYCYLEPGDELVEYRITTNVLFGNLISELTDAAPTLLGAGLTRYGAGMSDFEQMLVSASELGSPVVLIVDGLDHISRTRAEATRIREDEIDIVEQLSALKIPPNVTLVLGSQPGDHLSPLAAKSGHRIISNAVPTWAHADIIELAKRCDLDNALTTRCLSETDIENFLSTFAQKSEGSPLYARYLIRELTSGINDGSIISPFEWLDIAPKIGGDIEAYYLHLFRGITTPAQPIVNILAAIEFSVTRNELQELLPTILTPYLSLVLSRLSPVLTTSAGQGGIRIFHESFRRFLVSKFTEQGAQLPIALDPVIHWLQDRGFYKDAKSYRFLLPALRRANREHEVLQQVGTTFVSDSVSHGHVLDAIQRNLSIAADIAGRMCGWSALARLAELQRSADYCFSEGQNIWEEYWATYLEIAGPAAVAERLLFDGRPTQDRNLGLLICALVDDAGGTAPWREYLDIPREKEVDESSDTVDPTGALSERECVAIAATHGLLRLGQTTRVVRWLYRFLQRKTLKPKFVRTLFARIARVSGHQLVQKFAARRKKRFADKIIALIHLGLADEFQRQGLSQDALISAARAFHAISNTRDFHLTSESVVLGVNVFPQTIENLDLEALEIAVGQNDYLSNANGVRDWVASIRLLASASERNGEILAGELRRVSGIGWYRSWLRFVVQIAIAEANKRRGERADVLGAFEELLRDATPFSGNPRACDLYAIRRVIFETLDLGLSLLNATEEWTRAIEILLVVSVETNSRLDRSESGPIRTDLLLDLLLKYVDHANGGALIRDTAQRLVEQIQTTGTYYSSHAEYALKLARIFNRGLKLNEAQTLWKDACVYLAGYGFRKDVTIFEVIDSAPALTSLSQRRALLALADTQPLTMAVLAHTDGRSTNQAPNAWFEALLKVAPERAIMLLTATIRSTHDGGSGWMLKEAIRDVAAATLEAADPMILELILSTQVFEIDYESDCGRNVDARVAPARKLHSSNRDNSAVIFRRILAEVSDCRRHSESAAAYFSEVARSLSVPLPVVQSQAGRKDEARALTRERVAEALEWMRQPVFSVAPNLIGILNGIRDFAAKETSSLDSSRWEIALLPLSYLLREMLDQGREQDVRRIIRFLAREIYSPFSERNNPLETLAVQFDEDGHRELAAMTYTLAYACARGDGGWLRMGGKSASHTLMRAIALDRGIATQVLAEEIGRFLSVHSASHGVSQHLVERIAEWGDAAVASEVWQEAFWVISHRLPLPPKSGVFERLDPNSSSEFSLDEALIALLLSRLNEPYRPSKVAALAGLVWLIQNRCELIAAPLIEWLSKDTHTTSVLIALEALLKAEQPPFVISQALQETLHAYAEGGLWGAGLLARELLHRIGQTTPERAFHTGQAKIEGDTVPSRLVKVADVGDSLSELTPFWPELPGIVDVRLIEMNATEQLERRRDRAQLAFGRNRRWFPPAPVLMWETELFVTALHETLMGLSARLTGPHVLHAERDLLQSVMPHTAAHIAVVASRTVRPSWPPAQEVADGLRPLCVLENDDPEFEGWTRLAIQERQYLNNAERPYSPPSVAVDLFAGIVAASALAIIPPDAFPLQADFADTWWNPTPAERIFPHVPLGPVIGLERVTDWLGDNFLLIPPLALRHALQLKPASYGDPLIWRDQEGRPAVVGRTWWTRHSDSSDVNSFDRFGMDLIARPDAIEALVNLCHVPLRELCLVRRHNLDN